MSSHNPQRKKPALLQGHAPRKAALDLLLAVRRDGHMLSEVTDAIVAPLSPSDRARAARLADQVLRHGARLEALLTPFLSKAPPLRVRLILALAAAELCIDKAAAHGVVNAAVALTRANRKTGHLSGLVNAVLRKVSGEDVGRWADLPAGRLPPHLRKPWLKLYGARAVAGMETAFAASPPLDLTPKHLTPEALADRLGGVVLPTGSVRLAHVPQVSTLDGYDTGDWWVQDAAAAMPARVLDAQPGERVLDLCAAPGGKTLQLAAAGATVTALDISGPRSKRLAENLARCGLSAEIVTTDALVYEPDQPFDAILLDAPCTATGTIRRHPDLPWVKNTDDIESLADLQRTMLRRALTWLQPGGRLVYATCSLWPQEGEAQIRTLLEQTKDFAQATPTAESLGLPPETRIDTGLRLRPDLWSELGGMDGFFVAKLVNI